MSVRSWTRAVAAIKQSAGSGGKREPATRHRATQRFATYSPVCELFGNADNTPDLTAARKLLSEGGSAARCGPLGAGVTRTAPAVPTTVLSRGNCLRRTSHCSNRRNRAGFQLLAGNPERGRFGGPDSQPLEPITQLVDGREAAVDEHRLTCVKWLRLRVSRSDVTIRGLLRTSSERPGDRVRSGCD